MGRAAFVVAIALVGGVTGLAEAQVRDLAREWRTVRSQHFEVHYPEPLAITARRTLAVLEKAQQALGPQLGHEPRVRTQVVLTDVSESANGSATVLDYNTIRLFAAAPEDLSILADYDDWLTVLGIHEHAHILHLDNIGGLPRVVNKVFGKIWAPNQILPRWLIEGIATYFESSETAGGRLRSTQFEMYMRMAVLEDAALRIDQLSNVIDQWPRGNAYYLYGSRFIQWMVDRYGVEVIKEMSRWYGRRAIPFSLNRMTKRLVGKTFTELYDEWLQDAARDYGELAAEIRREGFVQGRRLTYHGELVRAPRFWSDKELVYYVNDGRSDAQLRRLNIDEPVNRWRTPRRGVSGRVVTHKKKPRPGSAGGIGKESRQQRNKKLVRVAGVGYASVHPDGSIYHESLDNYQQLYFWYDLFRYDPTTRKRERLTEGLRARYPDVSPDGRQIAFVRQASGTSHLYLADTDRIEQTMMRIVTSRRFGQVFTPRFSPDGRRLAYSVWREGGYRDVEVMDLASGEVTQVTHDRALDTGPAWSPNGSRLYFSSDRTGIANIYAWEPATGVTMQITNVVSGAYHPAPSPDGHTLAYLGYTHRGFDLYALTLDPTTERVARPYDDQRPPPVDAKAMIGAMSERYRPIRTVYPRNFWLDFDEDGFGRQIGVTVDGEDAARFHLFSARVGVSLEEGYVNADVRYTARRLPAPITASFFRRVEPRRGLVVGDVSRLYVEDAIGGRLSIAYTLPRSFHANTFTASYGLTHTRQGEPFGGVLDPNDSPPSLPNFGFLTDLSITWAYSDVRRHVFDISPSEGRSMSVALALSDPKIGSEFSFLRISWLWRRFIEMPWAEHHVVGFRYGGGYARDSRGRRGAFALGGFPDVSFSEQLFNNSSLGGVALRGYAPFSRVGDQFHLLQSEYRFPITRIQAGPQTTPLYARRMWGTVFVDVGDAYFDNIDFGEFRVGVGAELFVNFLLAWELFYTLRFGFAYGIMDGGGARFYTHFGVPF